MMKNQDTCCFYLVSCPCRARDRAAITFIHNDDDLHFLASERMDLTNAKQNKYIFIFKKREKKRPRDDRLWILCRWDRKRQQASKTQWDHFGRRHWIRNTLSTRYRSLEKGCLCAEECIFIVVVIADNVERAKEWALFFIKPEEKKIVVFFPANAAIEIEPNPKRITSKFNVNGTSFGARSLVLLIFRNDIAIE